MRFGPGTVERCVGLCNICHFGCLTTGVVVKPWQFLTNGLMDWPNFGDHKETDYASKEAGGAIISIPETEPLPINQSISLFYLFSRQLVSQPDNILEKSNTPGNCFAFCGSSGRIRIKLSKKVKIVAVTLDHAPFALLDDLSHAPRDFAVYGLKLENSDARSSLGKFQYKLEGMHVQTFVVNPDLIFPYEFVELEILNNHGNENLTCVYRFRGLSSVDDDDPVLLGTFEYKINEDHIQTFLIDPVQISSFEYIELRIKNNQGNEHYTCLYRFRVHASRLPIKN
ncbi:unnamed protein product [Brassicogethes aeneus]|uniref:SUN domain-containing protein n=1 Tax=Brassicogethes aeneus TaxID=1431903 RepID=A0A9P0BKG5_BRAAE|nr:unnamed protein product [Brassicogethes aeneus]